MHKSLSWKVLPARNRKKFTIFISTVTLFVLIVYLAMGIYWAFFSLIILLGSLFQFYTVTEYILDDDGITIKRPFYSVRKKWEEFRRVEETRSGIFLSPFSQPSRLDSFRGVHLIIDEDRKTEVLEFIRDKIKDDDKRTD